MGGQISELEHFRTEAWSTVWRCRHAGETLWFKQSSSANPAEGAVHAVLAELAPRYVRAPVAWDSSRGWLLTRDGGTTMLDWKPDIRGMDLESVAAMLRDYAQLQIATVGRSDRLLKAGLKDFSPARAGTELVSLADEMAQLAPDDPRHISAEEHRRLLNARIMTEEAAELLMTGPVPVAFDHNDLFPRNIFVPRGDGAYRFFDFAESILAHPFGSLVMLQWELIHRLGLKQEDDGMIDLRDERIRAILDAYLSQWLDFADLDSLRRMGAAAMQLAPLHRAWVWMEVLREVPAALEQHGKTPRAWIFDIDLKVIL